MAKEKIFISSTRKDLTHYRKEIIVVLEQMGLDVLAMEKFAEHAYPNEATEVCFDEIDDCDTFVGIYGFYYGYCPSKDGSSITEQEYDYARRKGKACFCYFAHDSLLSVSPGEGDENRLSTLGETEEQQKKLFFFKDKIEKELVRGNFKSIDDLSDKVKEDIKRGLNGDPIGLVYNDVVKRLFELEKDQRMVIYDKMLYKQACVPEYKSPLDNYWQDFIEAEAWHDQLKKSVRDILDKSGSITLTSTISSLLEELALVNWNKNYNILLNTLALILHSKYYACQTDISSLINKIKEKESLENIKRNGNNFPGLGKDKGLIALIDLSKTLNLLKKEIENPSFNRCFSVLGSTGAGKTHFIASIMGEDAQIIQRKHLLFVKLDLAKQITESSSGDYILHILLKVINGTEENSHNQEKRFQWKNLEQLNEYLGKNPVTGQEFPIKPRLVVVIDDLEECHKQKDSFIKDLIIAIENTTCLHSFFWLLTLNYSHYEMVMSKVL